MTKSGTHDNDAYNFVQVAMWEFHGSTPITVYYFYTRCKEHLDIDCIFQLTTDESSKEIPLQLQMMTPTVHQVQ